MKRIGAGRRGVVVLAATWTLIAAASATLARAAEFEPAGKVPAARYLPASQMAGEEWKVAPEAENDGAFNTYVVESRFGNFEARGNAKVAMRGREVGALLELEKVSKSEVFLDAVKDSALGSIETVMAFATKPVETVKGIPKAVGRFFKKTKFQVEETYVDAKQAKAKHDEKAAAEKEREATASDDPEAAAAREAEKEAKKDEREDQAKAMAKKEALDYLKISGAERRWYAELGVDPYTDNQVLRDVVKSYARVEGLTKFGMKFAGIPAIPGAREIRKTMNLVWQTDPWELRLQNRNKLLAAGISEETARAFEDNPYLSLTQQTGFLAALEQMPGVKGRASLIARVIELESKDDGQQLFQATLLLARHHNGARLLAEILEGTELPVARSADGKLVAVLGADALFWTEPMSQAAAGFAEVYRADPARVRELWVVGQASDRFKSESGKLGWTVHDRWQAAAPEDKEPTGREGTAGG
ncbi:MAG: hypothetical protein KDB94_07935 [Acidobacteria bacterium]|nr:hypothetical protein [Acidobacteriota bacterium]